MNKNDGEILHTLYIVGKGPSLKGMDLKTPLYDKIVCGINDVYTVVKCRYICHWDNSVKIITRPFQGIVWSIRPHEVELRRLQEQKMIGWHKTWINKGDDINLKDGTVPNVNLSGVLAISCAILEGFSTVYLLGFDGGYTGTVARWFNSQTPYPESEAYEKYNQHYEKFLKYDVRIVNVINPEIPSRITCFETMNINDI